MATNIVYETLYKKFKWHRWGIDAVLTVLLGVGWSLVIGFWLAVPIVLLVALAWTYCLTIDLKWRTGELTTQDRRYGGKGPGGSRMFIPLPLPRLTLTLWGPVLHRRNRLEMGDWPVGHEDRFEAFILNPSLVVPQYPMTLEISSSNGAISVIEAPALSQRTPEPGELIRLPFRLKAIRPGRNITVLIRLTHGTYVVTQKLHFRSCVSTENLRPQAAEIRRWKGGAAAGFAWRGDHDLYDPATFQDAPGLRLALGLAKRFHIPTSIYMSGRLSLDENEHQKFCEYFGFDRRTREIPEFIRFLREECSFKAELDFPLPLEEGKPFAAELGNHMYLHYGTHAVACEDNQWILRAKMGEGAYSWQHTQKDSFHEQKDNVAKNNTLVYEKLGVKMLSWGSPGGIHDNDTGKALESAGILVSSGSDSSKWQKVWKLNHVHHPRSCPHLVEVSTKYPGDCDNANQIAMVHYWLGASRRKNGVFVLMNHHHLKLYESWSCFRHTENLFRYLLAEGQGDFYIATISALGLYWERVLCPEHRCIKIDKNGQTVTIQNTGDADLDQLPLEIDLGKDRRFMTLVDVPAGGKTNIELSERDAR
ncbi:MAG: hypothetical protein JXA11_14650 [Phycisphaerae bacterium]|nr:hypothetical protein [Phycisphaerae bacterium]